MRDRLWKTASAIALFAAGASLSPASAVSFNLTNVGGAGAGTQARMGFDIATKYWSSVLTDNVVVNLEIGFDSLGENILGQTGSNSQVAYVSDVYDRLKADRSSKLDNTATDNLPVLKGADQSVDVVVNAFADPATRSGYTDTAVRFDNDKSANNFVLAVNTANLKALGFTFDANGDPIDTTNDGSVVFSSDFQFDFDPTDGIAAGDIDFIAVAIHEIGHALGFVSGVDTYDFYTSPGSPQAGTIGGVPISYAEALQFGLLDPETSLENFAVANTLDLFRYNGAGQLDWSTSDGTKFFSVDGNTPVYGKGAFSLGAFNGDGNQASHWLQPDQSTRASQCSNFLGIMNPYICDGQGDAVTGLDLAAMDVIGWNLADNVRDKAGYSFSTADAFRAFGSNVPEPATWAQFILGFGLLGALARRKRMVAIAA